MRITAKTDYAMRAAIEMAAAYRDDGMIPAERIANAQSIPVRFLLGILNELRHAGLVTSRRGQEGGYRLARPPEAIMLADVIRAIDGPLANIAGTRPDALRLAGTATSLQTVWIALRANVRAVLETVSLADVASGALPPAITGLADRPGAWDAH